MRTPPRAAGDMVREGRRFELVIMDPPRAGARGAAAAVVGLHPRVIIYISCHPAALNRDLAEFASFGFRPREWAAFDLFPQTSHLEIMAVLSADA